MEALFFYMAIFAGIGLVIPVATILFYPVYKLFGGELTLGELMEEV